MRLKRKTINYRLRNRIIERDKGICQICFMPVDMTWTMRGNRFRVRFHLDHIIPFKDGGPDTFDNLRLTHIRCNLGRKLHGMVKKRAIATASPENSIAQNAPQC